jgi:hypothetical protein
MNKKFGAWDSLKKKFLWPWPEAFHIFGETTVIVQFIGLKDIKGKEAYSGAIFKDNKGVIRTIFEVPGGFATESNPISFGYGFQSNSNPTEALSDKQTASWFEGNCEIIGNIFENPELLNKKI